MKRAARCCASTKRVCTATRTWKTCTSCRSGARSPNPSRDREGARACHGVSQRSLTVAALSGSMVYARIYPQMGAQCSATDLPIRWEGTLIMQERESDQLTSADDDSSCVDIQRMSLESAIRQAAEAIVITSATGKIQFVNPAFTTMTGYRPDEDLGQFPNILKSGVQDPAFYEDLWRTILAGQVWRGELINRRKDGTVYTEELSITMA